MRPKRPVRPPPPPPPPPAVVTPESLAAINSPEVDKLPAYISPGKFQWKPPLPGPKGDQGAPGTPGEPGATARPITPPVTTDEIADGNVTPAKLSFTPATRPLTPPADITEIADGAITTPKVADRAIWPGKLERVNDPADTEIPSYDSASGKFKWVPPPAGGGVQMKTGTYTGNDGATKAITGVGFRPKYLMIYDQTLMNSNYQWFKTDQDGTKSLVQETANSCARYLNDMIISLDADGFTIGQTETINAASQVYTYVAFG